MAKKAENTTRVQTAKLYMTTLYRLRIMSAFRLQPMVRVAENAVKNDMTPDEKLAYKTIHHRRDGEDHTNSKTN